jgi:hypothetical protein
VGEERAMDGARRGRRPRGRGVRAKEGIRRGRRLRVKLLPSPSLTPFSTLPNPLFKCFNHVDIWTSQEKITFKIRDRTFSLFVSLGWVASAFYLLHWAVFGALVFLSKYVFFI